jgi:ubiquinone/menaquinone biosynthesis C-methylase UbiE
MIRKYLPYFIYKRLFGDRKKFYNNFNSKDKEWKKWIKYIVRTYSLRDKTLVDRIIKKASYSILKNKKIINFNNKTILELGPGRLEHLKIWNKDKPNRYDIADVNLSFLKISKSKLLKKKINSKIFVLRDNTLKNISSNEYDYIVTFFSLEHIMNIDFFLDDLKRILKTGGKLIFAIPNEGFLAWGLGRYFFTRKYVNKILKINYDKIICWEHPNYSDKIINLLNNKFNLIKLYNVPNFFFEDLTILKKGVFQKY